MAKKRGGGKPPRDAARFAHHNRKSGAALVVQKKIDALKGELVQQRQRINELGLSQEALGDMVQSWTAPLSPVAVSLDPDELHFQTLVAQQNALLLFINTLMAAPKQISSLLLTVQGMILGLQDLIEGRQPENFRPVAQKASRPPDENKDWIARTHLAVLQDRTKRLMPAGQRSESAAYQIVLRRVDQDLQSRFGLSVEDVIPPAKSHREVSGDQSRREEIRPYDLMIASVAQTCEGHRQALEGAKGTKKDGTEHRPPPDLSLRHWNTCRCQHDQEEHAGTLSEPTDAEIGTASMFLRISFGRRDHERRRARITEEVIDSPDAA